VEDARLVRQLRDQVLATYLADNSSARHLLPDGTYERRQPAPGESLVNSQAAFLKCAVRHA